MSIKLRILKILRQFHWFRWYEYNLLNKHKRKELMTHYHSTDNGTHSFCKEIVCLFGKHFETGGLADRLRGIVSVYQICKANEIPFKICWTQPFPLERFLEPNKVLWKMDGKDICWYVPPTEVISAEITEESAWQERKIRREIEKCIRTRHCQQLHIYTNMRLAYEDGTFPTLFRELFKPSIELEDALSSELQNIGSGEYIAVQCRFVGILGDFKDITSDLLSEGEKTELMGRLISAIEEIHNDYPVPVKILLCTDSPTFRSKACDTLSFIYAVRGDIEHIDYSANPESNAYMKLFLDLFLMSKAKKIYRVASERMRFSGLPYMASLLEGKQLIDIKI